MSVVRIGDRQVDTDIEIPEEVCGLCDGTGEECESRGVPQKCSACKGSGVLNSDAGLLCHCQDSRRGVNSYRPTHAEITRSEIQGDRIAMYNAEF